MNEQIFGIYELDEAGNILYSRRYGDVARLEADRDVVGQNFFEEIPESETAESLKRQFTTFVKGRHSVFTFFLDGMCDRTPVRAKVLMTRGHETHENTNSEIVIMDIKKSDY